MYTTSSTPALARSTPGVVAFTPVQLLRLTQLFASDPALADTLGPDLDRLGPDAYQLRGTTPTDTILRTARHHATAHGATDITTHILAPPTLHALLHLVVRGGDQRLDLLGGTGGTLRKLAHLLCDNGKPLAGFTGTRRFHTEAQRVAMGIRDGGCTAEALLRPPAELVEVHGHRHPLPVRAA